MGDDSMKYDKLKAPLFFSVTGHRNIHHSYEKALNEHLKTYFAGFKKNFPNTPLYLMSALAEGADRIVTKAANEAGVGLKAVLPMSQRSYEETFSNESSTFEFRELLKMVNDQEQPFIIPDDEYSDKLSGEDYNKYKYRALGEFMITNSHVLIALWDGEDKDAEGGTSDVVRMARFGLDREHLRRNEGSVSEERFLDLVDRCLVYHINVSRNEERISDLKWEYIEPNEIPGNILKTTMDVDWEKPQMIPDRQERIFERMEIMNEDMLQRWGYREKWYKGKKDNRVLTEGAIEDLKGSYLMSSDNAVGRNVIDSGLMDDLTGRFTVADRLAIKYQRKSFFNKWTYLILTTASSFLLMLYLILYNSLVMIALYFVFFVASIAMYSYEVRIKKREAHVKFLEYRMLAEYMRVYYYWGLVGVDKPMSSTVYEYLRNPTGEVRNILRGWTSPLNGGHPEFPDIPEEDRIELVRNVWVRGQLEYHKKIQKRNSKRIERHQLAEYMFSAMALATSAAIFLISMGSTDDETYIFGISAATLFLVFNVIVSLSNIIVSTENTIQGAYIHGGTKYEIELKMLMMNVAGTRLDHLINREDLRKEDPEKYSEICRMIYYELGIQCMEECSDWSAAHASKYIKRPKANTK